jgi:glycerol uptake facilitator-like aquaporin
LRGLGTFILILLGDGVVANVGLAPRLAAGAYNWNTITFGWAFAVIVAVYVSAGVSGAHLNPAVTIALAMKRGFPWSKVVPYILAQMVGAFLGALGVYLTYRATAWSALAPRMSGARVPARSLGLLSGVALAQPPLAGTASRLPFSPSYLEPQFCCGASWPAVIPRIRV